MRNIDISREPIQEEVELPPSLSKVIEVIFREYPELRDITIKTFASQDYFDVGGYYEFVEDAKGKPVPQICISKGDANLLTRLFDIRRSSIAINAQMLGIESKDMTPELLQIFIIAHEFGHIKDYKVNFEGDPNLHEWDAVKEMDYQREAVLSMLPIPNITPTHLAIKLKGLVRLEDVVEKFPDLQKYTGFKNLITVEDVLTAQEIEYKSSTPESYADKFATDFLRHHASELGIYGIAQKKEETGSYSLVA